jgi:hypothetical protein
MKRTALSLLILMACTGCSLNVLNGTLVYDSGDTRVQASRVNSTPDGGRSKWSLDTKADDREAVEVVFPLGDD